MIELTIKTPSEVFEKFKSLSQQHYKGDDAAAFHEAVLALISLQEKRAMPRLQAIVDKIRADVKSRGGLTGAQIDQLVRQSRKRRRTALR